MIIKSSIRGFSGELADHLGNTHDNETATITGVSDGLYRFDKHDLSVADELRLMFAQMDMNARRHGKDDNHIYHVSLSPAQPLKAEAWGRAWAHYEAEYSLQRHDYVEVTHEKEGRLHKHRAYYALDEHGRCLNISHNYPRNEKISRVMEHEFGHDMTAGRHNRSVMKRLHEEGRKIVAAWMEQKQADQQERPAALMSFDDYQQEQRTTWPRKQAQADVREVYERADNGKGFETALLSRGYFLAQGEKRPWVVLDPRGGVHSAPRYAGVKKAEFESKVSDLKWEQLPSVRQVQDHIREQEAKNAAQKKSDGGEGDSGSAGSAPRPYKKDTTPKKVRAHIFSTLNDALRKERMALRKAYHDQRRALWKNIGNDYQAKREALKSTYKPKWKDHFGRKHEELRLFDEGTRNLSGRILMAVKYRDQIGQDDMSLKERVNAYVQHIVSQKKWLDAVEARYENQRHEMFLQYKTECGEIYKENRAAWQPTIEKAQTSYKEEARALTVKQDAARQSMKTLLDEQRGKPQKARASAIDRVAAMREKNKDKDGAERER